MNPLKPQQVLTVNPNGDESTHTEFMTYRDAAKVAFILMLADFFTDFIIQHPFDPACGSYLLQMWLIASFTYAARSFLVKFIALTGLASLGAAALKRNQNKQ